MQSLANETIDYLTNGGSFRVVALLWCNENCGANRKAAQ
jgi:hypothetical protein